MARGRGKHAGCQSDQSPIVDECSKRNTYLRRAAQSGHVLSKHDGRLTSFQPIANGALNGHKNLQDASVTQNRLTFNISLIIQYITGVSLPICYRQSPSPASANAPSPQRTGFSMTNQPPPTPQRRRRLPAPRSRATEGRAEEERGGAEGKTASVAPAVTSPAPRTGDRPRPMHGVRPPPLSKRPTRLSLDAAMD